MFVHTEWSRFTNGELIRLVLAQKKLTSLEAELLNRLIELEEHIEELAGDDCQMELPIQ